MILRLTQKLKAMIKPSKLSEKPEDSNLYADWSSHFLSADRTQYFILTNARSLYSCVMYARGCISDSVFIDRTLNCLREFMEDDGQAFVYQKFIAPETGTISFAKTLNRSVMGSMNDMIFHAKVWLVEEELSPHDVGFKLNDMPMSALATKASGGYGKPSEEFKLFGKLG